MKLKEFIKDFENECNGLVNLKFTIDLGIDNGMNIDDNSQNRIKFSVLKQKEKDDGNTKSI